MKELCADKQSDLLLYGPGLRDRAQVAGGHHEAAEQRPVILVLKVSTDRQKCRIRMRKQTKDTVNDENKQVKRKRVCTEGPYIFSWPVAISNSVNEFS